MSHDVRDTFDDAVGSRDFVRRLEAVARREGFRPGGTLLVTGSCRDELCFPFGDDLQARWGSSFHIGSLGGLIFLGRTGLSAAAAHAPRDAAGRRYLVVATTHVGIDRGGRLGFVQRPHQDAPSTACGALVALHDQITSGHELAELDPDDLEQGLVSRRLAHLWPWGDALSVLDVTLAARDAIRDDLLRLRGALDIDGAADVLLVTGVLVHAPDGDWIAGHHITRGHPDGRLEDLFV